jgi:hypothetical protein
VHFILFPNRLPILPDHPYLFAAEPGILDRHPENVIRLISLGRLG